MCVSVGWLVHPKNYKNNCQGSFGSKPELPWRSGHFLYFSREPEDINETIKMYKLQPIPTISRQSTAPNLNSIETVETITCKIGEETKPGRTDCLCWHWYYFYIILHSVYKYRIFSRHSWLTSLWVNAHGGLTLKTPAKGGVIGKIREKERFR